MEMLNEFFKNKGYNVVAVPKSKIKPLELLAKEGRNLTALGNKLDVMFEPDEAPLPRLFRNSTIPDMQGKSTFEMNIESGFNLFEGLLNTLKLGKLEGASKFNNTDKILFTFDDIKEDGIKGFLDLDNYISGSIPVENKFRAYEKKLKDSELFTITSVLKCKNFTVKVIDKDHKNVSTNVEVKEIASGSADLRRTQDNAFKISYKGEDSLVFAFKAVQIIYDRPKWFQFWKKEEAGFRIKAQTGFTLMSEEDFPVAPLTAENEFLNIDF